MRIYVEGISQFTAALRRVEREIPGVTRAGTLKIAQGIATASRQNAREFIGQSRIYGKSGASIRAGATGSSAIIRGGGGATPYFWGAEYGARRKSGWYAYKRYRQNQNKQWLPWRGNQWGGWEGGPGYMINPAIREHATDLLMKHMEELTKLYETAFNE